MTIGQTFAQELRQESIATRKTLERLPDDKWSFQPHVNSMPLGRLATHVAELTGWVVEVIDKEELDFDPATFKPWVGKDREEVLATFEENLARSIAALERVQDEHLARHWSLKVKGQAVFTLPRVAVLRSMVLNHIVHHRAQLGIYLRLNNVPVPSVYGPSADEEP